MVDQLTQTLAFQLKVCGLTRPQDVIAAKKAGFDAVGFNFVARSPRFIQMSSARKLFPVAKECGLETVAVMMNSDPDYVRGIIAATNPDYVQLHGTEDPNDFPLSATMQCGIIKGVSWSGRGEEGKLARQWSDDDRLSAFLVDAYAPIEGGGTGRKAAWHLIQKPPQEMSRHPVVLAGGLTPENVAEGISSTCAVAVDTASGVESSPGVKDFALMKDFVDAALVGFVSRLDS